MKTYYLYVNDDGSETHYLEEPRDVKTLKVMVEGAWETTMTYLVWPENEHEKAVRPRGEGWAYVGPDEEIISIIWRRKRRRK